jgi:hypothetical protein
MDQNAIAELGVGQAVGLIDPAPHRARIAFDFGGKGFNFE